MEKKKAYIYIIGFFAIVAAFILCYFFSYRSALNRFNKTAEERNANLLLGEEGEEGPNSLNMASYDLQESVEADAGLSDIVTAETVYVLEEYDINTNLLHEEKANMPEQLIGLNRIDLITYINEYMLDMPLEEYQRGLSAYEIISFSPQKVIMRKTYNSDLAENTYYLLVYDGFVVVYYSDKKTVYEYTDIKMNNLPEEEQQKLSKGFYVKDQEELYGILENYSS